MSGFLTLLLFIASAVALVGSVIALLFKNWRKRAKRVALVSAAALVLSVSLIIRFMDEDARAKGFSDNSDLQAAKRTGITDVAVWKAFKQRQSEQQAAAERLRSEAAAADAETRAASSGIQAENLAAAAEEKVAAARFQADSAAAAAEAQAAALRPPSQERQFIEAIVNARSQYKAGSNDLQKGAARPTRARSICNAVSNARANDWIGTVDELSTNGDGNGVLSIKVAEGAYLKTYNNAVSDYRSDTLIKANSSLYRDLLKLKIGETVRFSGTFFAGDPDCFLERSMTLAGSISAPEFVFRFSRVEQLSPLTQSAGR